MRLSPGNPIPTNRDFSTAHTLPVFTYIVSLLVHHLVQDGEELKEYLVFIRVVVSFCIGIQDSLGGLPGADIWAVCFSSLFPV